MNKAIGLVAVGLIVGATGTMSSGALVHRYSFNDTSTTTTPDLVGSANATLVNGATDSGTQLVTAGGGSGSGGTSPAASLPATAVAGVTGDFAVETFFTAATTSAGFATLFNFSDATNGTYFIATPNRGSATGLSSIAAKFNGGAETTVTGPNLNTNTQHQFIGSYSAGTGMLSLFVDGALVGGPTAVAGGTINLSNLTFREGVNGLAGFGDPALTGSNNDFRIYNNAISAAQAALLSAAGPDATNAAINAIVPEPASLGLLGLGAGGLMARRRRL